jgi:hypothetical protein
MPSVMEYLHWCDVPDFHLERDAPMSVVVIVMILAATILGRPQTGISVKEANQ